MMRPLIQQLNRKASRNLFLDPTTSLRTTPQILSIRRNATNVTSNVSELRSPRFPGAVGSALTTNMRFVQPSTMDPIPTFRVMNSDGEIIDKTRAAPDATDEEILKWYTNMLTVNILDSIMFEAQRQGRLSFYMVSAGEEALMVGSAAALGPDDIITAQYRETGVFQQRGFTLKDFMSQLFSNKNDPGKGRNMPVHYSGKKKTGVHAIASTLGTQIPHATGAGYALKMKAMENPSEPPAVAAAYFGEGAASEGDFHAALNIAATRKCPVIFICRNNGFAISTPTTEQYKGDGIASRGIGYGIDALRVDGNDIFAVNEATKEARRRALEEGGRPILLEFMSYRLSHHSTSDDSFAYRTRSEVDNWKGLDNPITRLRKWLEREGLWDEKKEVETRTSIRKAILKEVSIAEMEKKPPLINIWADVYSSLTEEMEEQREEMRNLMTKYPEEYDAHNHEGGLAGL